MANINQLLKACLKKGYSLEDAAFACKIDIEKAKLALAQIESPAQTRTLQQILDEFKPKALEILMEIAENGERDSDRVKACQILLTGEGQLPQVSVNVNLTDRMGAFTDAVARAKQVIEVNTPKELVAA